MYTPDRSYEPMDIDLSGNSIKSMDISSGDCVDFAVASNFEPNLYEKSSLTEPKLCAQDSILASNSGSPKAFNNIKKYNLIKQHNNSKCIKSSLVLLVVLVSVIFYHAINLKCCDDIDMKHVRNILSHKLFGQTDAVDLLMKSFDTKASSKILFLLGGTGVGKTYAVSLMLSDVWNSSNVYHYTMPTFIEIFSNDLLVGMLLCKSSVLVVDDLTKDDNHINGHIKNVIEKSEQMHKNITVVLIYNTDNIAHGFMKTSDAGFYAELEESFKHITAYKELINFKPLTKEHLKLCIENELGFSNIANIDLIMKSFNVELDGCKGVHSKIKSLNVM